MPLHTFLQSSLFIFSLHLCIFLFPFANAQKFQPVFTGSPSSVFIDGQALYVLGGEPDTNGSLALSQTFSIDLTVSWNANRPVYRKLPDGPKFMQMATTLSSDGQNWLALNTGVMSIYNFKSTNWTSWRSPKFSSLGGVLAAATDPDTGLIYVPNGYQDANSTSMLRVNLAGRSSDNVTMEPHLLFTNDFATAWSPLLKSMIFVGGNTGSMGGLAGFNMFAYNSTVGWTNLTSTTSGTIPPPRIGACLVPAYNGSKMVLFSGFGKDKVTVLQDIYVLDVATMTWTRGPNVATGNERGEAACAVSNDYFIAWGGLNEYSIYAVNTTLVYNIKTSSWTSNYVALPIQTTSPNTSTQTGPPSLTPSASSNNSASNALSTRLPTASSSSRLGVIVGASIGTLALVIAGGGAFMYRARRKQLQNYERSFSPTPSFDNGPFTSSGHRLESLHQQQENPQIGSSSSRPRYSAFPMPPSTPAPTAAASLWAMREVRDQQPRETAFAVENRPEYASASPLLTGSKPSPSTSDEISEQRLTQMSRLHDSNHGAKHLSLPPPTATTAAAVSFSSQVPNDEDQRRGRHKALKDSFYSTQRRSLKTVSPMSSDNIMEAYYVSRPFSHHPRADTVRTKAAAVRPSSHQPASHP